MTICIDCGKEVKQSINIAHKYNEEECLCMWCYEADIEQSLKFDMVENLMR